MNKKFFITTSIAYTNALPHIGFALETIQADVLARHHRLIGNDVFFLTGTDEHGTKIAKSAKKANKTPEKFTNEISKKFKELTKILNLSNNDFIRTTDKKRHFPAVEKVWLKLYKNKDIYKKKYKGLYCVGCEEFIKEKDLINEKCPIHEKKPNLIQEENYFFKLSKYSKKIEQAIKSDKLKIIPKARKNEILSFLKKEIEDISFSRSRKKLKWGIPVPNDNTQTIYVWSDALINYISALGYSQNTAKFKKFWPANIHCVGKDIIRFHAIIWPAILLSLKLKLPKTIFVHGYITSNNKKMSKSLGNVVDPFGLVEKYGTDSVRYFLLREIPSSQDGDFSYEKFEQRYNSDLASGIGNLFSRVMTLAVKMEKPNTNFKIAPQKLYLLKTIKNAEKKQKLKINEFKFNEALEEIWKLISFCDKYIEKQKPWKNENEKTRAKNQETIYNLLFAITSIANMLQPFLPETSEKIFKQIGINPQTFSVKLKTLNFKLKNPKTLFPRL
ncbi:MAG: methionine--tRNA ligase [Patescibacteria group bacterium]|nr:methionine--tRNA ligase [Patescibacteria group bacterium]